MEENCDGFRGRLNFLKDRDKICSLLPVAFHFPKRGFDGNDYDDDDGDKDDENVQQRLAGKVK